MRHLLTRVLWDVYEDVQVAGWKLGLGEDVDQNAEYKLLPSNLKWRFKRFCLIYVGLRLRLAQMNNNICTLYHNLHADVCKVFPFFFSFYFHRSHRLNLAID